MLVLGRWKGTLVQEDIPLPYLKLTENLDYLGVRLNANYSATRRENGEILKQNVKDQLLSWNSGIFLPSNFSNLEREHILPPKIMEQDCLKTRAMVLIIHTFLEQAISLSLSSNQCNKYLYKWHVLEETNFPNQGRPPYYS